MKLITTTAVLFFAVILSAQNLILNGEFDKKLDAEARYDAAPGVLKRSIITEDRTWNRCLKAEVAKHYKEKDGSLSYHAMLYFGGNAKTVGFKVKPNTLYNFTFEIKGMLPGRFIVYQLNGPKFWKNSKSLPPKGDIRFKASEGWSVYRGSFQTGPDAVSAVVGISLWGRSRYKNLPAIGSYVLIDKIKVTEKTSLLPVAGTASKVKFTAPLKKTVVPEKMISGFTHYKTGEKVKADTQVTVIPGAKALTLKIRCLEPMMDKLKAACKDEKGRIWSDDLVEIFFGPVANDRPLSQFVITAGGGRWMGRGNISVDPADYGKWNAKVTRAKDSWSVEAVIPYELLGAKSRPAAEKLLSFNVARTRQAGKEVSSLAFAKGSFHAVENYAVLFADAPGKWFAKTAAALKKAAQAAGNDALAAEIGKWKLNETDKAVQQAEVFRKEVAAARLGNRTFALTPISPTTDPTIPLIPAELANIPAGIKIRAAVNDFKTLPLAITNLTGKAEEYRILITAVDRHQHELGTLRTADGKDFPEDKIQLLRGIRSKDGDEKVHSLRFDALAPVDISSTAVVQPREATPVWAVFDTAGVAPGKYRGVIRVIPLSESAPTSKNGIKKQNYHDMPVELEVLPFEISRTPAIPQFLFSPAYGGKKTLKMMFDYGINNILVNTWGFAVWFNPDGSVKSRQTGKAENEIASIKQYAAELGVKDYGIGVAYGVYSLFRDRYAKHLKYGTPQWEKGWRNYIRIIDEIRRKNGFSHDRFFIEICDEPRAGDMEALIKAAKIAREEVPGLQIMITFASWDVGIKNMEAIIPYLSHWCFWGTKYIAGKTYAPLMKKLRAMKKNISIYSCDTSMRVDLQKYYRTHNWRALAYDLDMCNLYQFSTYRYKTQDWKGARYGEVALHTIKGPVSTIRLECLRIGANDIKYMKKLAEVLKNTKSSDAALKREAAEFLKSTPMTVGVTMAHDAARPEAAREKAIDLILKLTR